MSNILYFPLIIFSSIIFFGFSELLVINEEILLLLCFVAFFFNMYIFFGLSIFESFKGVSDLIRLNFFNNFQATKNITLLASKSFHFAEKKAVMLKIVLGYAFKAECQFLKSEIFWEFYLILQRFIEEFQKNELKSTKVENIMILANFLYLDQTLNQ